MKQTTIFITGTDTGIGKTVLTTLLTKFLRERGVNAAGLKPICSDGRDDARKISAAMNRILSLGEINPWHFRAPVAPLLAARREHRKVRMAQVLAHVRALRKRLDLLVVEGAGGLLSPLGEDFDSRDLIQALQATPVVVAQNRLGAVNQILLTLEALPKNFRRKAKVVLMAPIKPDAATKMNARLMAEFFDTKRIFSLPWLGKTIEPNRVLKNPQVRRTLRALAGI
jgi:dethiobiotin synthetase